MVDTNISRSTTARGEQEESKVKSRSDAEKKQLPLLTRLQAQHRKDLKQYRSAHKERTNRILHQILIPVQYYAALVFVGVVTGPFVALVVGGMLGVLSMLVSEEPIAPLGAFLFFLCAGWSAGDVADEYKWKNTSAVALILWNVSWGLQVGVGHYTGEGNESNVAKSAEVSYLSMALSVLIAWSS
mmetsp:Transcript_27556/g.38775  ORF Transcript_27556/g.38775 Transcript_27556/m.38775 type:complete len:185 (-) Transcript_27556:1567-2121(-)